MLLVCLVRYSSSYCFVSEAETDICVSLDECENEDLLICRVWNLRIKLDQDEDCDSIHCDHVLFEPILRLQGEEDRILLGLEGTLELGVFYSPVS